MQDFLSRVRVNGVGTEVENKDRILIAAAAIIPIFRFKGWKYYNIHTVLLYPDRFSKEYQQQGGGRNVLGMVGEGPMQNMMVISKQDLRHGFKNDEDPYNTAIHEFVHLLDKSDGSVDGVPTNLMKRQYVIPWLQKIHREIERIKEGDAEINPYGATNEAEFLAVASEYFFEQPEKMQAEHPRLYAMLEKIFTPQLAPDNAPNHYSDDPPKT